jgi:hypothetical protein
MMAASGSAAACRMNSCVFDMLLLWLNRQIVVPYLAATGAATVTALTLNMVVAKVTLFLKKYDAGT